MEFSKLPVAKRTRSGSTRFIEEKFKRFKSSGTVAPVPDAHVVPEVNHVVLDDDDDDDDDEGLSRDERGKCKKSRKCRGKSNKGKVELDHKDSDSDLIVVEDCNDQEVHDYSDFVEISVGDKGEGEEIEKIADDDVEEEDDDEGLSRDVSGKCKKSRKCREKSNKGKVELDHKDSDSDLIVVEDCNGQEVHDDSDFVEISVVDKGEEEEIEKIADDDVEEEEEDGYVREDMPVNLDSYDSLSSSEDFSEFNSDVSYRGEGFIESDHAVSLDDSSSFAESEDEGNNVSDDDCEIGCRVKEKNDGKRKGKGKLVEGRGRKNVRGKKEAVDCRFKEKVETFEQEESSSCNDESDDEDGKISCDLDDDSIEVIESPEFKTSVERKNRKQIVKSGFMKRTKNMKMATRRKLEKDWDAEKHLVDIIAGMVESRKKNEKEETKYKFRFTDKEPVKKSEFDIELDGLFEALNTSLTCEDIGSNPLEVDNLDHSKMQSDCSRGNHHLVLDEQIGRVCKYCSHVSTEIRHILPDFSNSYSPRRRRSYFVQSECPIFFDHFQDTGSEQHDYEDYNTMGTVWDLVPGARSSMYEHQREGFEFIWNNLIGGIIIEKLEKPLSSSGSGCIISHAPGTGKTRLTMVFLQSFMRLYPDTRPVIIAPKSMLLTWEEEFKKWKINIPFHNMNNPEFSGQENPEAASILRNGRDSKNSKTLTRLVKLCSWKKDKSILGITYTLFDKLVRAETRNADCSPSEKQMGNALLKLPSLIVLDEGHTPRNDQSGIYNSLLDVETQRRIILSGTPFQNNFDELYNTLRLVNPKFDRKSTKFDGAMKKSLRRISKELKSNWSGHKLMELKHMISPFVHVHKGKILQTRCPGLKDAVIRLQLTDLQQELISALKINDSKNGYFELSHDISLVSVHPSLLPERCLLEHQFSAYKDKLKRLRSDPYSGAKTKFVIELCRLSVALKEKVLIYSQYINPLVIIKEQLQSYFGWTEGREILYMDGSLEAKQRQSSICALNDPRSKARVLLASIKACSEGIHLVGASRVVLLDVVWNPSVERQAISRAYRLGQKKIVYTYRLIAEEMEIQKYKVQTAKDWVSEMVFSSKDLDSLQENMQDMVSEDRILQEMYQQNDKLGGLFKQIVYQPKVLNMVHTFDMFAE